MGRKEIFGMGMGKAALIRGSALLIAVLSIAIFLLAMKSSYASQAQVLAFENSSRELITLDKEYYLVGEPVVITSSVNIDGSLFSLAVASPSQKYVFMGDGSNKLSFMPKSPGNYEVQLTDSRGEIIFAKQFTVYDSPAQLPNVPAEQEALPEKNESVPEKDALNADENNSESASQIQQNSLMRIVDSSASDITGSSVKSALMQGNDLKISFLGGHFKEAVIKKFGETPVRGAFLSGNSSQPPALGIDVVPPEKIRSSEKGLENAVFAYSIDPSSIGSDVTITLHSYGRELWKCAQWNFSAQTCTGTWTKLIDIVPGQEYSITVNSTDPAFAEIGLSTINTNKSAYRPSETAKIFIVVLNSNGIPVSGAYVNLTVTSPSGISSFYSTSQGTISEERRGVYSAIFSRTYEEGTYSMQASARAILTDASFSSNFSVSGSLPYEIIRQSTIILDPKKEYVETSLQIISYSSGNFNLTEEVPDSFQWISGNPDVISYSFGKRILTWVNLSNNSVVKYSIDAPLVWPASYELRARIDSPYDSFLEARPWYVAVDPATGNAILAYGIASNNPRYVYWDGSSLSGENSALNVGANPRWVRMASNPNSEEIILATIDATPSLNVQVWNGTGWISNQQLTTSVQTAYQGFDVAYEHNSGRAIVAYRDGTNIPKYYIWNGTNWSSAAASAQNSGSAVRWLELASDPNSNYIIMVTEDASANADINAQIWNGTAWLSTVTELDTASDATIRNFDVVWDLANHSIVAYGSQDANVYYAVYNRSSNSWPVTSGTAISVEPGTGDWPLWIELASSKKNNYLFIAASDDGNDLHAGLFNSTNNTWTNFGRLSGTVSDPTLRNFDAEFESVSGNAILVYGESGANSIRYRQWVEGSSSIGAETTMTNVGDEQLWVELAPNPDTNEMLLSVVDAGSDLTAHLWDGGSWTYLGELSNGGMTTSALGTDIEYEQKITIPPYYTIWNLSNSSGIIPDYSNQTRGEIITAFAKWNMKINQSYAEHNGLSMLLNFSVDPPFTDYWTNYSLNTSKDDTVDRLGLINVSIYAKNFGDVWSTKTTQKHFYLWANLKVSSINLSKDVLSVNESATANCQVSDYRINIPIASYNVSFYINSSFLGKNTTDANGWASYSFSRNSSGAYLLICN
ncbi:MAG: hypothetical protein NTZ02_03335, partial [Candidatus Woesearchaeota archaeon]|nr:hypothetical protein [Candidatus Woesearchaeota archaeon]